MAETVPRFMHLLTPEEFLVMEETASVKHEYLAGEIYEHAGAMRRHNLIAGNILGLLWTAARGGKCRVLSSDMLLRVRPNVFYYPDVQVVCDPADVEERYTTRPCVVVEVLSLSTESIDRREKVGNYLQLESLQAYLIVSSEERRVVRYFRDAADWALPTQISGEGIVRVPCPEVSLSLDEIYEGL